MTTPRTRLMAISGATLALVLAGTAVAAAHPREDDRGFGFGPGRLGAGFERGDFGGLRPGGLGRVLGAFSDSFVRTEVTVDLGDDGIVTRRTDNGTVASATDAELSYTLATGESASVTVDEDTLVVALSAPSDDDGDPFFHRVRLDANEIALADIAAGSDVIVWATSQDDGTFLAGRIAVQPAADVTAEGTTEGTSEAEPAVDA